MTCLSCCECDFVRGGCSWNRRECNTGEMEGGRGGNRDSGFLIQREMKSWNKDKGRYDTKHKHKHMSTRCRCFLPLCESYTCQCKALYGSNVSFPRQQRRQHTATQSSSSRQEQPCRDACRGLVCLPNGVDMPARVLSML